MSSDGQILSWVKFARTFEIHKAGDASGLIDWYEDGADGQIDWGQPGDFEQCVAIAGKYIDNPEGFCQLRHIGATGEPAGHAESEISKADDDTDYTGIISDRKGEPANKKLYSRVKADAKKKFDVYPSAVANGWVVQEYKRRGGTYRKPVAKSESFTPPKGVQEAAKKALAWMKDGKAGDGFTSVGRKRASDLANGHAVSMDTLKRMKAYFDRHQGDKDSPHWDEPSPGKVAWYAWGGDAGYSWAKSVVGSEIQKGDFLGHIFHGNQFTGGEASGRAEKLSSKLSKKTYIDPASAGPLINEARDIADIHQDRWKQIVSSIHNVPEGLQSDKARFLSSLASDQWRAYSANSATADAIEKYLRAGKNFKIVPASAAKAAAASAQADKSWERNKDFISTNTGQLALTKGDDPGHPFRGNQWTGGEGNTAPDNKSPLEGVKPNPTSQDLGERVLTPKGDTREDRRQFAVKVLKSLNDGKQPVIDEKNLETFFEGMKGGIGHEFLKSDITELRIDGTRLMGKDGLGIARVDMPQVETEQRPQFLSDLEKNNGVTATKEDVDPTTLKPVQKEVFAVKSAAIFRSFKDSAIPDKMRILISKDGYVLDGHHTWAAAVGIHFHNGAKMPVYRLSVNHGEALKLTTQWANANNAENQGQGKPTATKKALDFITSTLLSEYLFFKGDLQGHVFRGNQHSKGGIVRFDPYNALFTAHCASGHQNTVRVPEQWIGRNADGSFNGQFVTGAPVYVCSTCSRPIDNRWQLVNGQKPVSPPPTPTGSLYLGFGQSPKNYVK